MENSMFILFLSFCLVSHQALIANAQSDPPIVPALYVFGSSQVDVGNNNYLNTQAKANRWPYGIDFHNTSTGRWTNGKNVADFFATYLDLPLPPAYLNLTDSQRSQTTTGISYASGSCGILNTTGAGECLRLARQVELFTSTVKNDLPKTIQDQEKLQEHLANSIYLLFIGNNDYNDAMSRNMTNKFDPAYYADYLLDQLTGHIKTLYDLGARKYVVLGVSICAPHNYTQGCKSRYYADKLPQRLQGLQSTLSSSMFTMYDVFKVYDKITKNQQTYGIINLTEPCHWEGGPVCPDRSKYLKFDQYGHLTEAAYEIASNECFYGTACYPYNVQDLAKTPINH